MAPLTDIFLHGWLSVVTYLGIGIAFGAVLEMAGFGDSRRLAAQFYFKDMTVLKVMFTAIVTAMVLVFGAAALGLLDYNRVWVPPTYLVPGIVGGLIMGVGFIIGGFCPGTSLVALATFKIDGLFFFLGVSAGVFVFGETVTAIEPWWNSTYFGRLTLQDLFGIDAGWVVLAVVLMALFMFWGSEKLERIFGGPLPGAQRLGTPLRGAGGALLAGLAVVTVALGQPTAADRWARVEPTKGPLLGERKVQIHPGELRDILRDFQMRVVVLDVRDEGDFNVFHLVDSRRVEMKDVESGAVARELLLAPPSTVTVLVSDGETRSTEAWKLLAGQSVPNLYLLEGGLNGWLDVFGHAGHEYCEGTGVETGDALRHRFDAALGARQSGADPDAMGEAREVTYTPKVVVTARKKLGGGCG